MSLFPHIIYGWSRGQSNSAPFHLGGQRGFAPLRSHLPLLETLVVDKNYKF